MSGGPIKQVQCKTCGAALFARRTDVVCTACKKLYKKNWYASNTAYYRARYAENLTKERARKRAYRESHKLEEYAYRQKYFAKNPGNRTLWDANRRAQEKRATVLWGNEFFMAEAYRLAKMRERVCGGKWHVDHIVPLQSKIVCGLHVECNLQVIPAKQNSKKSNVFWPDMP